MLRTEFRYPVLQIERPYANIFRNLHRNFGCGVLEIMRRRSRRPKEQDYERKTESVYVGKIRERSAESFSDGNYAGISGIVYDFQRAVLFPGAGPSDLFLFSNVFQKYREAFRGESVVSEKDHEASRAGSEKETGIVAAEAVPYLQVP